MYLYCCSRLQGRDYQESAGQSDPLRLLCQTVTHRIPAKWYLNQSQSGILPIRDRIERNTQPRQIRVPFRRYRPVMPERLPLCTPFPLISNSLLSLYSLTFPTLSWFPTTGTYSAFNNLRRANKNHKADNTWRDAVVITERSDDIFPD